MEENDGDNQMKIIDLSSYSKVGNSGKDVTRNKIILVNNYPYCKKHGAMNKVSKDGIWRYLECHVGCKEVIE